MKEIICPDCHRKFNHKYNKYCGNCLLKLRYNNSLVLSNQKKLNRQQHHFICKNCSASFSSFQPKRIYCSKKCAESYNKKQQIKKYNQKWCFICKRFFPNVKLHKHHIIQKIHGGIATVWLCEEHHKLIHKFMNMLDARGYKIIKKN